ncbi:hypothetical protein SBBP2_1380006 [Burkholderiales bacterium]|nr:hypothetical protein SBBP2_1380006 [Burkholderiales bacterium]
MLAEVFVLELPQSKDRIRGADRFVRLNYEHPAHGLWGGISCRLYPRRQIIAYQTRHRGKSQPANSGHP